MRAARRINVAGTWVSFVSAAVVFGANVTWARPVVDRVCEPQPAPLPELCTTIRTLADDPWRAWIVWVALTSWAVSGAGAWKAWRSGQLQRTGPPPAFPERRGAGLLRTRRRIVMLTPGVLAAISFTIRKGADEPVSQVVDPVCSSGDLGELCASGNVVVQQTVVSDIGMSPLPQVIAWMLVCATSGWWMYVIAAENLARRFGEENLWRPAMQMRRKSVPEYPAEQQRGNRY